MKTTQRRVFRLDDLPQGIEWATPLGRVTFTERKDGGVSVNINGTHYAIYGGARHTLNFINKKIADAEEIHGKLVCY